MQLSLGDYLLILPGTGRKTQMPFVPFLLLGYIGGLICLRKILQNTLKFVLKKKSKIVKGSMTIETAFLMPLILFVLLSVMYLFFWVHNRTWLTAAAYEAALDGSMEIVCPDSDGYEKALKKGENLEIGFFGGDNLKIQASTGKNIQITYDLDMFSLYGGTNGHLQVQAKRKGVNPVSWIRKVKGISETIKNRRNRAAMKAEYKRDINGNYLVLYENEEPDTSFYQMRMLVGNTIPSILKCRVQGVDGQFMVCFDITSKQSVASLYEEKKIRYSDLQIDSQVGLCR